MSNPFDGSIGTARMLADFAHYVPSNLLEAAAEALGRVAHEALEYVKSQRGHRGNPAKRDQAWSDLHSAAELVVASRERRRILHTPALPNEAPHPASAMPFLEVEAAPDLGPKQWAVVAANADTWSGTPSDLYMVAKTTVPDEQPLDLKEWLLGHRRHQCLSRVREAEQRVQDHLTQAQLHMAAAHVATKRATQHGEGAERWLEVLSTQTQLANLTDEDLAAYESAVIAGMGPADALATVLGS